MYFRKNTGFDPSVTVRSTENYRPSIGTVLYHGMKESWETSSLKLGESLLQNYMSRGRGNIMTPDEWRASKFYRPGLEYEEGMTDEFAKVLAARYDRTKQNEIVFEKTGALGATAYFGSALLGALPDPINVVPFMGLMKKTRPLRTRMSKNALGRVGIGAIESGAGAAALQPLLAADRLSHQERYDAKMAATDILVGIGAGGFLTGVMEGGKLALKKYSTDLNTGIQTPIEEPRVARNLDRFSIEGLTNFFRRGFLQFDNNRPVDVAGIEDPGPLNRPVTPEPLTINGLNTIRTDVGNLETQFEIVELNDVIPSNIDRGNSLVENKKYDAELQPRDRDSAESLSQIQELSDPNRFDPYELLFPSRTGKGGAPIIGPDNMVESGNGRTLVLGRIFKKGGENLQRYKDGLKEWAPRYGLDPSRIDGMQKPILVRRRTTDLERNDRLTFTRRSNTDEVARMQLNEIAISDASMMDENLLRFLQDQDIRDDANLEFVNRIFDALPSAERKGLTTKGKINEEGYERIERALLAKAFHSAEHPEFLSSMINLKGDDFKQISNALKNTARRWVYMKAKMKAGVFINQDPTSHLLEAINEFKNLKRGLRSKAAEKFTEEDIQRGVSEKLLGKSKGFRYVLREHVNVLRDQMNLDPTIGTHANTVLFLDFLSVADSQEKIELGLRAFIDELEAYPADQPGLFEQPSMEAILDRTIGAHRTNLKVDVQRMETPERPPEDFSPVELLETIKGLITSGKTSKKYLFHTTNTVDEIVEGGLKIGGFAGSPIGDRGLGNFVHVFLRSDLPKSLRDAPPQMVELESNYKPIKPIWTFLADDLELEDAYLFRSQELGDGPQPPTEIDPATLAGEQNLQQKNRQEILDIYEARNAFDETSVREEVTQNQVYAQDEEIDFKAREEEEVIEDIPEQGPTESDLEQIEALADQELNQMDDWNAEKELAEVREMENVGDAMADDSPMMNCILGKI